MATASSAMGGTNSGTVLMLLLLGVISGTAAVCTDPSMKCAQSRPDLNSEDVNKGLLLGLCTQFPTYVDCFKKAAEDCGSDEKASAEQLQKDLENVQSACTSLTADGRCNDAVDCLLTYQTLNRQETCRDVRSVVTCLQTKSKTSSCSIDESGITFSKVLDLTANMCPAQDCAAAFNEVRLEKVPSVAALSRRGEIISSDIIKPRHYCKHLSKLVKSYINKQAQCGFTAQYVNALNTTYQQMMNVCYTALASRPVPETMLALLATTLALWLSLL